MGELFADRYDIQRELGRGGFGVVYLAHDSRLRGRPVALKVLHPALSADLAVLRLFEEEAGTLASLTNDHIVPVFDAGVWQDRRYIVMQYVDGPSLAQVVKEQGAQPPEQVVAWLRQAADALGYAHERGVLHRDVKSANLLLDAKRERLYMSDFGLARAAEVSGGSSRVGTGALTGTAAYRAPEVARTGHTIASDLYSLGVVAYELLAGRLPFQADDPLSMMMLHATEPVPPLPDSVPAGLAELIMRLLAKDPAARPSSASVLGIALSMLTQPARDRASDAAPARSAQHDKAAAPAPGPVPTPAAERPHPRPRWLWPAIGAGGLVLLAVLTLVIKAVIGSSQATPVPAAVWSTAAPVAAVTPAAPTAPPLTPTLTSAPATDPASVRTLTHTITLSPTARASMTLSPTKTPTSTATATWTATSTMTATPAPAFTVKEGSAVNVRSGPGTDYPMIGVLQPAETREVTGRTAANDWWQFDFSGQKGWVSGQTVTANPATGNVAVAIVPPTLAGGGIGKIAFSSNREGVDGIYVMNADGTDVRRLISGSTNTRLWGAQWSSDASQIAFESELGGGHSIYVMRADGTDVRRLTNAGGWDALPAWSPDDRLIAFSRYDGKWNIYTMSTDGASPHRLTDKLTDAMNPTWSPDGRAIAYATRRDGRWQLYVMNADGTNQQRLTSNSTEDRDPAWSPDDSFIAFVANRDGNDEIYVMNSDGTNQRRLTTSPASDVHPTWSPDGRAIAFWSNRDGNDEIYIMDADGTNQRNITRNKAASDRDPAWAPR